MTLVNDPAIPAAGSLLAYNIYISGVVDLNGYYFHGNGPRSRDHLGSTRRLRLDDKSSTATYEYTPYGDVYAHYGGAGKAVQFARTANCLSENAPRFRTTGHAWDSYMGMVQFAKANCLYESALRFRTFAPYRWYNPTTARWLTRDPLGMVDGPNVYAYVRANPVGARDYSGLSMRGCLAECLSWEMGCFGGAVGCGAAFACCILAPNIYVKAFCCMSSAGCGLMLLGSIAFCLGRCRSDGGEWKGPKCTDECVDWFGNPK